MFCREVERIRERIVAPSTGMSWRSIPRRDNPRGNGRICEKECRIHTPTTLLTSATMRRETRDRGLIDPVALRGRKGRRRRAWTCCTARISLAVARRAADKIQYAVAEIRKHPVSDPGSPPQRSPRRSDRVHVQGIRRNDMREFLDGRVAGNARRDNGERNSGFCVVYNSRV
jgi:hypothetical protein